MDNANALTAQVAGDLQKLLTDTLDPETGEITPFDFMAALMVWEDLAKNAEFYKTWEMEFRKACFSRAFPNPTKGTNNFDLGAQYVLKGVPKVNVKIDQTLFPQVRAELAKQNVALDPFLKVSYSLVESEYKAVTEDEEKNKSIGTILRTMLTFTPGAPELKIVLPAKYQKK